MALLSLLLVLGASPWTAGSPSAAQPHKEVNFTNSTSWTIELAVVMREQINCGSDGWIFSAWWTLPPGATTGFNVIGDSFYYHAQGFYGTDEGPVWDGEDGVDEQITLYASRSNFDWCQYDSDDWWNLHGGGIVNTAAEGHQITLGHIDLAGRSSASRNFTEWISPDSPLIN